MKVNAEKVKLRWSLWYLETSHDRISDAYIKESPYGSTGFDSQKISMMEGYPGIRWQLLDGIN
jgi:hypothetical protein